MRIFSPEDRAGDALFQTLYDRLKPVGTTAPPAEPAKPPKWAREKAPTDGKEAYRWLAAIEAGHAAGVPFYHPGLGLNVVKTTDGSFTPVDGASCDEEAWYRGGCVGTAPPPQPEKAAADIGFKRPATSKKG